MTVPAFWSESWTAALINHLWQSTVVVAIAWLLALALRKNHARTRYWVWMAASVKFLLPFSLLITAGEWLWSLVAIPVATRPAVANVMEQVTQPFAQGQFFDATEMPIGAHHGNWLPAVILAIWICGALVVVLRFGRGWWRVYAAKRAASPIELGGLWQMSGLRKRRPSAAKAAPILRLLTARLKSCPFKTSIFSAACRVVPFRGHNLFRSFFEPAADVKVLCSASLMEPGIFGIFRPVLLMPNGILERLTAEQLQAIVAHEMCHVRRRDNLTFAIHMLVETLFWFHPAVWWIGARLVDERERACDEAVVQAGGEAQVYAEGILNVCRFYVESPLECVAGVTGADLKKRIARIMSEQAGVKLTLGKKLLLSFAASIGLASPILFAILLSAGLEAQLLHPTGGAAPSFEVATIEPSHSNNGLTNYGIAEGRFRAENATVAELIRLAYDVKSDDQLQKGPDWTNSERFDIEAKTTDADAVALQKLAPTERFDQYRLMVQSLLADRFKLKVSTREKELPVYAMVVAGNGPKLTATATGTRHMPWLWGGSRGDLNAKSVSMDFFAGWLSGRGDTGGRVVVDETGLAGSYDFTLKWTPIESGNGVLGKTGANEPVQGTTATDAGGPSLLTALQEQLGLKLTPTHGQVEVLVIDHVEKPSPN